MERGCCAVPAHLRSAYRDLWPDAWLLYTIRCLRGTLSHLIKQTSSSNLKEKIFLFPTAFANNFTTVIITRIFSWAPPRSLSMS